MRRSWVTLAPSILSAVALLLALCDVALIVTNWHLRQQTTEQGEFLRQTAQLVGVRDNLVRLIARGAVEDNNLALRDLLTSNGYHIESGNPAASAQPAPPVVSAPAPAPSPAPTALSPTKR